MGQNQSSPDLKEIDDDIHKKRRELLELKEVGKRQEEKFYDELFEVESELYQMKMRLFKKGEESKSIWNFWDYAKEVQHTLHSNKPQRSSRPSPAVTTKPSESRALVAPWYFFNIHSLFEAMLLRRLHIAMMLQGQRDVQSSSWNSVIVHIYHMIPGVRDDKKKSQDDFETKNAEIQKNMAQAKESYQKQLKLQKEVLQLMIQEARKDNKQQVHRESTISYGSASTKPLPDVVSPPIKSPSDASPTDDSSDASSLTSSGSSSAGGEESSVSSSEAEALTERV
ncbi:unnamed protein product [Cylindrotheca closterium]|uniref:Uncharacterized protein n=1 Tax=Cylindrotheca closterium TaxID=2856 RepID=A0AAD2FEF8_9STRA|nr:unnamed protein product [Cylindrotheca closterium]